MPFKVTKDEILSLLEGFSMYRAYTFDVLLFREQNGNLHTQVKSVGVWYDMGR